MRAHLWEEEQVTHTNTRHEQYHTTHDRRVRVRARVRINAIYIYIYIYINIYIYIYIYICITRTPGADSRLIAKGSLNVFKAPLPIKVTAPRLFHRIKSLDMSLSLSRNLDARARIRPLSGDAVTNSMGDARSASRSRRAVWVIAPSQSLR